MPSKFVQKALDIIRVFGNEAGSHVGKIDLSGKDNQETVYKLFSIMNFIVEKTITEPKTIDELTDRIPESEFPTYHSTRCYCGEKTNRKCKIL